VQRQLVANGQVLGRYGDAAPTLQAGAPGTQDTSGHVHTAEFNLADPTCAAATWAAQPSAKPWWVAKPSRTRPHSAGGSQKVASPWWRFAGANGLTIASDARLQAGQTLRVPKLALNTHNADSLQPYDPSRISGSLDSAPSMRAKISKEIRLLPLSGGRRLLHKM